VSATLLFATGNAGKLADLRALLGPGVEIRSLADFPELPEVVEDAATFEGNAEKKARALSSATGLPALADDSGLCVDGLGGAPGVLSARYGPGTDADRVVKLLAVLQAVGHLSGAGRRAHFACALSLALPDGRAFTEVGRCVGEIALAPRGSGGFGYDPVFLLPNLQKTMAELSREEKGAISHRGQALCALLPVLKRELGL